VTGIPNVGWTAPSALCEGDPSFLLDDLLDPGATSGGAWTVNGGTATSFNPAGLGAGSHQVTYTTGPANCQNSLEHTITIGEGPIAAFAVAPDSICLDESAIVTFTGSAAAGTVFYWDFGGGIVAPGTGEGPHEVSWPQAGSFTITLWLEEGNCISDTVEHSVAVFAPLNTPVPICGAVTSSSVEATWEAIPGAVSYNLIILSGQVGAINGTTVVFENLTHGEEVQFIIEAVSGGPCGNSLSDPVTCTAQNCIPADIDISEADPVCLDSGTLPFNLQATVSDSTGSGYWSGPGIVDSLAGLFDPAVAGVGSHLVSFTYQTDECISSSSVEISVIPVPEAGFILPESICLTDSAQIVFSGTASDSASYNWNFGDGTILSGSQSGPYGISWTDPGVKPVSLVIIDNGCISPGFMASLVVSPPLIPPVINCRTTISSIEFYWDPVAESEVFAVSAIGNLPGTITSDTSVLFANLDPLQEVTVELTFFSVNDCPDIIVSHTCVAEECPDVSLSISPVAPVCLAGDSAPFALSVAITGGAGNGSGTWQGPGITDSQAGMFDPTVAMAGTHTIIFTYSEGSCQYSVSTVITVRNTPIASFTHPDAICMDNSAAINFTGTAGGSAVFNWDFGSGSVVSGSGSGPYEISWDTPGDKPISLQIEENGCASDIFPGTITVDAPLEIPQITCSADYTSVEFSWPSLSGAAGFTVNVLQGPPGAILSDTSYLFEGLTPGQEVTLEVTGLSGNNCPDVVQVMSCSSVSCPTVNLNILPVDPVCIGQSAVSIPLDFTISGHNATGSLAWSGAGITDPLSGVWTADPSMAGAVNQVYLTYSESVCTFADSLLIEINAIPEAGFSAPGVICIDETASVVFTGANIPGSVYNWNFDSGAADPPGGAGPFEVSWGSAGNYQISLSVEAAGCMSETTVHDIQVDAPLQVPQISCQADFTSMLISWPQVDGAEDYALQINPPLPGSWISDTSFLLENLPAGTNIGFELTVSGNTACGDVISAGECAMLSCPDLALTWQAPSAVCLGMSAAFVFQIEDQGQGPLTVVVASGGDQYVLEGVTNGYTFDLELTQSGDFSIISAVGSGLPDCPVTLPQPLTVAVQQPVEAGVAGPAPEICNNENSIITLADLLGGGDAGGTWSETTQIPSTGGAFNSAAGIFNPISQAAGLYSFTYTVAAAPPCPDDMAQVQVRVHPAPVADAGQDVALDCLAGVVSLGGANTSAGPGLSYSWTAAGGALISDPASAFTEVSQPDVFTLTVIDLATGCRDQDEVIVDSDVDFLNPHVSISPVSCFQADDGAIQVDSVSGGQGPFSYSLNGGAFTSQSFFNRLAAGEYTLVISDSKGCRSELFFLLEQPDEVQVILAADLEGEERIIQLGDSLRLRAIINIPFEAVDTILWFPDTLGCSGCAELTVAPQQTSTFSVTVIDRNGCGDTDRLTIFVKKIRDVYIPNVFSPNGDGINDVFMIFGGQEAVKVRSFLIFNRWGESVFEAFNFPLNDQSYGWNGNFRGRPMNSGVFVYLAEIEMIDGETLIFKGDFNLLR
jgi:gliding motility-associated-like protein